MAGASGLFVMIVGALVGVGGVIGAVALFGLGFRRMSPRAARITSFVLMALALVALLLTSPIWVFLLRGRGSHGEPLGFFDLPWFAYPFLLGPPITIVALVVRLLRIDARS